MRQWRGKIADMKRTRHSIWTTKVTLEDGHSRGLFYALYQDGKVISGYELADGSFSVNGTLGSRELSWNFELTAAERSVLEFALRQRESGECEVEQVGETELKPFKEFREFFKHKIEVLIADSTFTVAASLPTFV